MSPQKPVKVTQLYLQLVFFYFFVDSFQFFGDLSDYYQAKQRQFYAHKRQRAEAAGVTVGCHLVVVKGSHSLNLFPSCFKENFPGFVKKSTSD